MKNVEIFRLMGTALLIIATSGCGLDPQFNTFPVPSPVEPLKLEGCKNNLAENYNVDAEIEDGSCKFQGCLLFDPNLKKEVDEYLAKYPTAVHRDTCPSRITENLKQEDKPHIGILWVIDNSFSMDDEQKNLGNNFNSFINQFINKDLDFTMGITTTDNKHVTQSIKLLTSDLARANRGTFIQDFKNLVKVGTNGSSDEKGYEGALNFLDRFGQDLLKINSHLVVIFVSDEADQSKNNPQFYLDNFTSHVSHPDKIRTHGILDLDNSSGDDDTKGARYIYSVKKTGGITGDVNDNFAKTLTNIGDSLVPLQSIFKLKELPYLPSLTVKINGISSSNWQYLHLDNAIAITPAPAFASAIDISYVPRN